MEEKLNTAKKSLDDFYRAKKEFDEEIRKQAENYFEMDLR